MVTSEIAWHFSVFTAMGPVAGDSDRRPSATSALRKSRALPRMQLEPRGRTHDGSLGHSSRRLAGLGFVRNLHGHGRAHAALAGVVSAVQAPLPHAKAISADTHLRPS